MNVHSANRLPKQEEEHIAKKSSMTCVSGYHIKREKHISKRG